MEIEIDKRVFFALLAVGIVTLLVLLGLLGKSVSPVDNTGTTRLLTWQGWKLLQAERQYQREIAVLRNDATLLADLLNHAADPVAGTITTDKIISHTKDGVDALSEARTALAQAAEKVRLWSIGAEDRDAAVDSLETAMQYLEP